MNTANLLLIGAGLWLASRILKRPGEPLAGNVVSQGGISSVSLGQANMGAPAKKQVGDTSTIAIKGSVLTKKGANDLNWNYLYTWSFLGQNSGTEFKKGSTTASTNVANGAFDATISSIAIDSTLENKLLKVRVRLYAAKPDVNGAPTVAYDQLLAETTVDNALEVAAETVALSGAISSVNVSQRGLMEMYAGRYAGR